MADRQKLEQIAANLEALSARIGHSTVVAALSYAIATVLGLSDRERLDVLHAGFVADIGMEIVPHHLLNRRGAPIGRCRRPRRRRCSPPNRSA